MPSPESEGGSSGLTTRDASSKRFRCSHPGCIKAFARKDYLERHAANHLTARPFVCPTCSKAYARADVLKRHMTNHPTRGRKGATAAKLTVVKDRVSPPSGSQQAASTTLLDHGPQVIPTSTNASTSSLEPRGIANPDPATDSRTLPTFPLEDDTDNNAPLNELYSWFLGTDMTQDASISVGPEIPYDWTTLFDLSSSDSTPEASDRIVDRESWQGLQDFIRSIGCTPPAAGLAEADVQQYVELYFENFQSLFPILHRQTLRSRGCHPMLLLSMVLLGSVSSSTSSTTLDKAEAIIQQRRLRMHIFEILETTRNPPLYIFQALFLSNYYGRMYADAASHDTNQIYHSAAVTAARFHGIFNATKPPTKTTDTIIPKDVPPEYKWMKWAEEEERVRLAWMIFVFDTFSAGILRHSVMLQCFSLSIPLPCPSALWRASSSLAWSSLHSASYPSRPFRPAIKEVLEDTHMDESLSPFARWCILHGLVSLTWSLSVQGADVFTLARRAQITVWKGSVYNALMSWQHKCMSDLAAGVGGGEVVEDGIRDVTHAGVPLCTICVITLLTDMDAVRILAGARRLNGRDISADDRTAARASLETWAQSSEGRQSCWCAIGMLQLVYQWIKAEGANPIPPSTLWCIYLATLVVWIFTALIEERPIRISPTLINLSTRCLIRAPLALHSSQHFLERVLASEDPINLPAVSNLEDCTALVASAAHLSGEGEWGGLEGATRVLYGLLKHVELTRKQSYANC
ncbi:hypothetical protein IAR50_003200 [Cryptococcus sp. DSM 104548]